MKLNASVLVAVAVMAGSVGAVGCKSRKATTESADPGATAEPAVAAPAASDPAPAAASATGPVGEGATEAALPTPPADKEEQAGAAPSEHHIWMPGYWHWDTVQTTYVWFPGYWFDRNVVATIAPPAPLVEVAGIAPGVGYFYAPGYWRWSGREYLWAPGHWTLRRDGFVYMHPNWEVVNGRWVARGYGWERRDAAWNARYRGWTGHGDVYVPATVRWDSRWEYRPGARVNVYGPAGGAVRGPAAPAGGRGGQGRPPGGPGGRPHHY
jgi:hypothetical protein